MSEKRNIRDHKRRAKYELRRKLYKDFCKFISGTKIVSSCLSFQEKCLFRVRNRCISTGLPRSVYEFFRICRRGLASRGPLIGIKKSSWLATTKPIEQGLAPQPVYKPSKVSRSITGRLRTEKT